MDNIKILDTILLKELLELLIEKRERGFNMTSEEQITIETLEIIVK